ncbi:GNAT family N-acetyltransferase [Psychromicrobium lacuslunae]|uniref:GNAT family acetyltransferase n=1 Tax=Psychromicrobium lacuslunae TaxID=1618207 RepID=A0A0D4BZ08_9MICC|nr:GNAT family N-acetyltransferase [Psychromicrobium lacuslunae]AJT41529.1 GNAT family acetyltransferase [Psychromicrobium lacuslunae]
MNPAKKTVRIIQLPAAALAALADGDLESANRHSPVLLTDFFVSAKQDSVWLRRSKQVVEDPPSAAWITGVVWDDDAELAVGRAGFHGPPDELGMVEVGYEIDTELRRRGYARAAFEALLARAIAEPEVHILRATIAPNNEASYNLVAQYGLQKVGEQWDEEDGLEIVYELAV